MKENKYCKILSSRYLSKETWATIRVDHIRLNNGTEIPDYYVHEYPNWVNVIAVTREQQLIIIQQYRHGIQEYIYEIPAGVCDPTDENPLESAKRELFEETGYGNGNWSEIMLISPNPATHSNWCYCFLATDVEKISDQHLEPTEEILVSLLEKNEVEKLLIDNKIKQAMNAAPLWKYMALHNK